MSRDLLLEYSQLGFFVTESCNSCINQEYLRSSIKFTKNCLATINQFTSTIESSY